GRKVLRPILLQNSESRATGGLLLGKEMDPGRYALHQGWDNNSALEGYGAVHEPNFRVGGAYDERRFIDERYPRDAVYQRNNFHRDVLEREAYLPPGPAVGQWSQSKRRGYDEDHPLERESRRFQRPYHGPYNQMDGFRDREIDMYPEYDKFRDGYTNIENYGDRGYEKPARIAMTGIMIMVAIVMILIMKKIAEEIVVGGDVNHAIENETRDVLVGKRIQVRIGNMSIHDHVHDPILDPGPTPVPILTLVPVPNLVDMMIIQNLGLLEVEAIVEVIGKTAMLIIDMIEVKDAGTVMINISESIILWYVLNGAFTF
ncbi:putative RNA-binding protein, partial [Trifolium medium]|nr:putative RNA-binding protein [Trifolium medium]